MSNYIVALAIWKFQTSQISSFWIRSAESFCFPTFSEIPGSPPPLSPRTSEWYYCTFFTLYPERILARKVQKTRGGVKICIFLRLSWHSLGVGQKRLQKYFSFSCWRLRTWLPPVPKRWECVGPFYWTWSLRGVVAVPLVRISGGWGALNSK